MTTDNWFLHEMTISYPTSLYDFFTDSKFINSVDKFSCIQTAILRYYLTAYTGKRLKSDRLNQGAISKQIQKLKKIQVDSTFDVDSHIELIKKGGEMYGKTKEGMKSHVSYGKRFFDFIYQSINSNQERKEYDKDTILSYTEAIMDKSESYKKKRRKGKITFLKNDPNLYLKELKSKYQNLNEKDIFQKAQHNLERIFNTINSFVEYRKKTCRRATYKKDVGDILRFMGWYKIENNLSIEQLDIKKIIPVISPYIEYSDKELDDDNFITKIAREEWILKKRIKDESKKFIAVLNKYLFEYKAHVSVRSKEMTVQSLIEFCRFLYKDITDLEENDNYQDISVINRLRVYNRDLPKTTKTKEEENIPFTWEEIEIVCERLRKEANQDFNYTKHNINNKGKKLTKKRKAVHIQKFLAIAFFCVMPPDRQRTFRDLTFGETLKYGIRGKNNVFRSYETLEVGETPRYYIHLLPHQYKTGETYGTYWHEINNVQYEDGKRFYDYLDQWFFEGYRNELAKGKTDSVFIGSKEGISYKTRHKGKNNEDLDASHFGNYIKNIFLRLTKYPLNPHALRKIYITHLNNKNVSEEIRRAIAYMMHHDLETANKIYNKQTPDEKIALGVDYLKQLHLAA